MKIIFYNVNYNFVCILKIYKTKLFKMQYYNYISGYISYKKRKLYIRYERKKVSIYFSEIFKPNWISLFSYFS